MAEVESRSRQRFALALFAGLFVASGLVSYFSIRETWTIPSRALESAVAYDAGAPEEIWLPPGPHRGEFQSACVICHSPRLALNQPMFSAEKWGEIVHKMATAYGAPVAKDEEPPIVEYLMTAQAAR